MYDGAVKKTVSLIICLKSLGRFKVINIVLRCSFSLISFCLLLLWLTSLTCRTTVHTEMCLILLPYWVNLVFQIHLCRVIINTESTKMSCRKDAELLKEVKLIKLLLDLTVSSVCDRLLCLLLVLLL